MVYVKLLSDLKRRGRELPGMEKAVDPMADYLKSWGLEMYVQKFAGMYNIFIQFKYNQQLYRKCLLIYFKPDGYILF